ncbi:peptidase [Castellaniella sp.]|nr:peptidase [Castellaniella sp.]
MYNEFNPATGLPMVGGIGGVDVAGNPWGVNPWSSSLPEDDDDF